jgi:WD40 repeat protein
MGNRTSINKRKLNEEYRKIIQNFWLFCPRCFQISSVKPFILEEDLYISLYCKCLYDERQFMTLEELLKLIMGKKTLGNFCKKHKNSPGFLYCIICEKWLCDYCFLSHKENYPHHLFNHIPLRLREYCFKHEKETAAAYCITCEKNVCEVCLRDKQKLRHEIFMFNNPKHKIVYEEKWETFLEKQFLHASKNEEYKSDMFNLINDSKDLNEVEKNNLLQKLNLSYERNKRINNKLCEYILLLFSNFDFSFKIAKIPNHNICNNIINLSFNNANFTTKESLSLKGNVEKLVEYFNDIHLLRMKPLVCVKNISSERQNVTNQIARIALLDDNTVATLISKGIVIVWNYITYDELYRIKKVTINEKLENENNNIINTNLNNHINDNINNYFIGLDEDDEEEINNNIIINNNNNIIQQQFDIFNQIQGIAPNNNMVNINNEIKKVNILKVYHVNKVNYNINLNDMSFELFNQNEINRINTRERIEEVEDDEGLDLNYNFTSIAFIKKYNILALIIENYNEIYLFDVKAQEALPQTLKAHKKEVLEIITLKNNNLASYGNDFTLRIWNMKHFQNVSTINIEIKKYYIYFTQLYHGNLIFAINKSTIKMLKLPEYEFQNDITAASPPINYFELPDRRLIIASEDYFIRIYEPPDYKKFTVFSKSRQKIYSFILLDMNRLLIGIEENGTHSLNILNWKSKGHKVTKNVLGFRSPIGSIVKTRNKRVITISWDNLVKVFIVGN